MTKKPWKRAIIHVDMNAFFASVEQLDFPELNGRPVAVTNGEQGTCIITCSYEARNYGIKTGMRIYDARKLCPNLVQRPSRPKRYVEISMAIMQSLQSITPDLEVFSVDEAFLDVTQCQRLYGDPIKIAKMAKETVFAAANLLCSVGLSGDKTTAKFAAKQQKPNGFTVILPQNAAERLASVPVTELCGIGRGIGNFLAQYGVYLCGDMAKLPIGIVARRFGNPGRRLWYMCQGQDPEPVNSKTAPPKSMGHGKVLPPKTRAKSTILNYFRHMSEKLAARLRRYKMEAQTFFVGFRHHALGWVAEKKRLAVPGHDGRELYRLCVELVERCWDGGGVNQVQLTALDPRASGSRQLDLFVKNDPKREMLHQVIDRINCRFGKYAVVPAMLVSRLETPDVIAPAWRPEGHRQTI